MYQKPTIVVLASLALGAVALPSASADPFLSVPPASFLNYHVATVSELSQEVALDPLVRARLARHFHRSEPEMTAYVRENLTLTHLSKAGTYRVACVTPRGREYYVTERLAAGTPVFASTRTGKPILKLACGNPLVATLPPAPPKPKPVVHVKRAPAVLAPTMETQTPAPEAPKPALLALVPVETPAPAEIPAPVEIGPLAQVAGSQQTLAPKGHGFPLLPVAAVGGIAALIPKGGGGTPPPVVPSAPPAVPEPSPLLLLGLGGLALAAWRVRTRRA